MFFSWLSKRSLFFIRNSSTESFNSLFTCHLQHSVCTIQVGYIYNGNRVRRSLFYVYKRYYSFQNFFCIVADKFDRTFVAQKFLGINTSHGDVVLHKQLYRVELWMHLFQICILPHEERMTQIITLLLLHELPGTNLRQLCAFFKLLQHNVFRLKPGGTLVTVFMLMLQQQLSTMVRENVCPNLQLWCQQVYSGPLRRSRLQTNDENLTDSLAQFSKV